MLNIDLTGGVSDQMVRYAICRSVSEKTGYPYGINKVASHDHYNGAGEMTFFQDIDYGLPTNVEYGELPEGTDNVWEEEREFYSGYNYHPFQLDIFDCTPNTKFVVYCGQDSRYLIKERVAKWFAVKQEVAEESQKLLSNAGIELDDNLCVVSARGGEYIGVPSLFLTHNYWDKAINLMLQKNPKMKFVCLTEDPEFYKTFFDFPVLHFSCQTDWWTINNCKNAIVANSGFNIFPIWLNKNSPYTIAPYLWANHNRGGYEEWANSNMRSWNVFTFIDRDGNITH
jgi:hypothetical protein